METKKSSTADLERRSTQVFLLGVVVVLTALYVVLEWEYRFTSQSLDENALDEIVKELDLEEEEHRIPLVTKPVELIPKTMEQLNIVSDQPTDELTDDQLAPLDPDVAKTTDQDEVRPEVPVEEVSPLDMLVVEQLPEFPGGAVELMKWLTTNLRYPASARQRRVQGRVVAQFIVNADGSLTDFNLAERADPALDQEALRVLRMMPPWKPGRQDQKPCRTMVSIPIVFKL